MLALQRMAGNAAVKQIARQPKGDRWFRGEAGGVQRTKPGQVVHDLGDGVYYSSGATAAEGYGNMRAKDNPGTTAGTGGFVVDPRSLGRVLDLTRDRRWADFLRSAPPAPAMGKTWREYMGKTTEYYNNGFAEFLSRHGINHKRIGNFVSSLPDFDVVIAEDLIRNPKTKQMVVMNQKIVDRIDAMSKSVTVVAAPGKPSEVGVGGGAGGGKLTDAPKLHTDRHGRVRLYRVITNAELQSLARHGDFNFAPSGGGKYFSFNRSDALALGAKSPGGASSHTAPKGPPPASTTKTDKPTRPATGGKGTTGGTTTTRGAGRRRRRRARGRDADAPARAGRSAPGDDVELNSIRGAEKQKAVKALEELTPSIEGYRSKGMYVTVTIEVEVPEQIDIAAIWAGIGDPGQVVYFKRMFIAYAGYPRKEPPPPPKDQPYRREPQGYHQNEATEEPRQKEWYLNHPRKGFRFLTRDMHLPPTQPRAEDAGKQAPPAAIIFRPVEARSNEPQNNFDDVASNRLITIDAERGLHMWNTYHQRGYKRTDSPQQSGDKFVPRRAKFDNDAKDGRHTVESHFEWKQGKDGVWEIEEIAIFHNKEFYDRGYSAKVRWVRD